MAPGLVLSALLALPPTQARPAGVAAFQPRFHVTFQTAAARPLSRDGDRQVVCGMIVIHKTSAGDPRMLLPPREPGASVRRIELPLAWPGILTALVLTFAHTLGEFGVVLMVGGAIPGRTKTVAVSIYDRVQSFDDRAAGHMALLLLLISLAALIIANIATRRVVRADG